MALISLVLASGCLSDAIKANQQQLAQQQVQLDQLKQSITALQNQRAASYAAPGLAANACDEGVMREAARKGGERLAASDYNGALAYYQDAVTACPENAQAHLNVARAYEATGDRAQAAVHYKLALEATGSDANPTAASQARAALARLQTP